MSARAALILIVTAVAAFAGGALAQDPAPALRWIGAAPSHFSYERYDMSLGVTSGQAPRRAERLEEDREVLNVPGHYGTLAGVTGDGAVSVFWFRDGEGVLRNVVVRDPASRGVKVQCVPTARYEADAREQRR